MLEVKKKEREKNPQKTCMFGPEPNFTHTLLPDDSHAMVMFTLKQLHSSTVQHSHQWDLF